MVTGAAVPAVPASDVREAAGCACLQLRRATRRMTRHFDAHLAPSGLTIGQFGFLAGLHRAQLVTSGLSLTALAGFADMDPTTLNRSLRPLIEAGLVQSGRDPRDRRVRLVFLTPGGRARLAQALPLWRRADAEMKGAGRTGNGCRLEPCAGGGARWIDECGTGRSRRLRKPVKTPELPHVMPSVDPGTS